MTAETFISSDTWECPAGVTSVQVESWAGGNEDDEDDDGGDSGFTDNSENLAKEWKVE